MSSLTYIKILLCSTLEGVNSKLLKSFRLVYLLICKLLICLFLKNSYLWSTTRSWIICIITPQTSEWAQQWTILDEAMFISSGAISSKSGSSMGWRRDLSNKERWIHSGHELSQFSFPSSMFSKHKTWKSTVQRHSAIHASEYQTEGSNQYSGE